MDCIKIENLEVFAHHGVFEEETIQGQNFYINAILYTDTRKAGLTDDLTYSTHYGEVSEYIHKTMQEHTVLLIETVAEMLAAGILRNYPLIQKVTIEVRKPNAPIPLVFESVSVEITRAWHKSYVALGSNMGERHSEIEQAIQTLQEDASCRGIHVSKLIETKPYGGVEQDDFLNGVLSMETLYTPYELLSCLQKIETNAKRIREIHWGPRTLDLDILLYDEEIMYSKDLTIPHYDMVNRDFVLQPLAQLDPYVVHPILHKTSTMLWNELQERDK